MNNKLEFTGSQSHQGDVQFFQLKSIPEGAKKVEKVFIAASERSGSFHALFGEYDMYEVEGGLVVDCKEECILNHSLKSVLEKTGNKLDKALILDKKDHRHSILPEGVHFFGIQQRFDPHEGHKKNVKD